MSMKSSLYQFLIISLLVGTVSCSKPNNYAEFTSEVRREFKVTVATTNENHYVASPYSSVTLDLKVFADNSINYLVFIDSARNRGDAIKSVEVRLGDPITENGTLLAVLPGKFASGYAQAIIKNLRASFIDTLLNDNIPKYINVVTYAEPVGLVRGQMNSDIVFSNNVNLNGKNIIPNVPTATTGLGLIRITTDLMLYSKILITNDEAADPVTGAKLFSGNVFDTGLEVLTLANSPSQLTNPKIVNLSAAQYGQLLNAAFYINVTSATYTNGKIRGQAK